MATYTYRLSGEPAAAMETALETLHEDGYTVNRDSHASASAQKGSTGKVMLLGAISPHVRLAVRLVSSPDGVALTLVSTTTGAAGGIVGLRRVKKAAGAAGQAVEDALRAKQLLAGVETS